MIKPILSLIVIVISAGFAFLYVEPAYEKLNTKKTDFAMLSDTLTSADEVQKIIRETKKSMEGITPAEYKRFEAFLPEKIDEIRFINNIVHMGIQRNIAVGEIKILKEERGGGGNTVAGASAATGVSKVFSLSQLSDVSNTNASSKNDELAKDYSSRKINFSFVAS